MKPKAVAQNLRQDVFACAKWMQEHPERFVAALGDKYTRKELNRLVSDLFSLCEIIVKDGNTEEVAQLWSDEQLSAAFAARRAP